MIKESFKGLSIEFTIWHMLCTASTVVHEGDIDFFPLKKTEFLSTGDTTISFGPGVLQIKQL